MGETIGGAITTIFLMIFVLLMLATCQADKGSEQRESIADKICIEKGYIGLYDLDIWDDSFICVDSNSSQSSTFVLTREQREQ